MNRRDASWADRGRGATSLPIVPISPGHAIGLSVAVQIPLAKMKSYELALNSLAHCVDVLCDASQMPVVDFAVGTAVLDCVVAGEAVIAFADAHPSKGFLSAQVYISKLEELLKSGSRKPDRTKRAWEVANLIGRSFRGEHSTAEERHTRALTLAACLIDHSDLEALRSISGTVPVLGIVGDTRTTARSRAQFYFAVAPLPGTWLGTSEKSTTM